jgi:TRAP-type C4-dicarboxylate transport system permease small subunit
MAESVVRYINRLAEFAAMLAFAVLVGIVVAAVFWRYVLNDSLVWAEELARYLFVWVTFLGGGIGVGKNIHVGVDSLVMLLPELPKRIVELCIEMTVAVFLVALIVVGIQFASFGMNTSALLLPIRTGYVYLAVPLGAFVMLANVLLQIGRHSARLLGEGRR